MKQKYKIFFLLPLLFFGDLFAQTAQQTNTMGVNIDTDSEANSFLGKLARGTSISFTELQYLDGVSSNLQTQLNAKLNLSGGTMTGTLAMGSNSITGTGAISGGSVSITGDFTSTATSSAGLNLDSNTAGAGNASLRFKQQGNLKFQYQWDNGSGSFNFYDAVNGWFPMFYYTTGTPMFVFNEGGNNQDFRIEGDTLGNLFYLDASADRIGINTATPASTFEINGTLGFSGGGTWNGSTISGNQIFSGNNTHSGSNTFTTNTQFENTTGSIINNFNASAGGGAGLNFQELGVNKAQFVLSGSNTYIDYLGSLFFRAGYGGATALSLSGAGNVQLGTGGTLSFASNSGTWNGSTIAGAQSFTGLVSATSQTLSSDDNVVTKETLMEFMGSEDYYIMREDWGDGANWTKDTSGTGSVNPEIYTGAGATGFIQMKTGATSGSVAAVRRGTDRNINPVTMRPWVWKDRTITGSSVADCKIRIGFMNAGGSATWASAFTGFEYNPASSANWRFYDSDSGTYTDTGVAVTADTAYSFKMRDSGADNQIYWSINGGSETLRTGARDYVQHFYTIIENTAAADKFILKDFTSFVGNPTR